MLFTVSVVQGPPLLFFSASSHPLPSLPLSFPSSLHSFLLLLPLTPFFHLSIPFTFRCKCVLTEVPIRELSITSLIFHLFFLCTWSIEPDEAVFWAEAICSPNSAQMQSSAASWCPKEVVLSPWWLLSVCVCVCVCLAIKGQEDPQIILGVQRGPFHTHTCHSVATSTSGYGSGFHGLTGLGFCHLYDPDIF